MAEVHWEAALTQGELAEASRKDEDTREAARAVEDATQATEDTAAATTYNGQDVGLQAGFKVLRQALV